MPTAWADWPLGLQSGKFDAVISNVTVTEERKEKFDFSTYRRDDLGFYVARTAEITSIKEPKDVAGLRIIVSSGTNQEKMLLEWDRQNVAAGLKPVEFQYYHDDTLTGAGASPPAVPTPRSDPMRVRPITRPSRATPGWSASSMAAGRYSPKSP